MKHKATTKLEALEEAIYEVLGDEEGITSLTYWRIRSRLESIFKLLNPFAEGDH